VTSNSRLARVAYEFGKDHESSHEISSVITDLSLANIAWLKAPLNLPDVPRLEVIAVCYAAMEPKEPLWSKYSEEIDKFERMGNITPTEHQALRYSVRARNELMNLTLGSEDEFSADTIPNILDLLKAESDEEKERALQEERERHALEAAELSRQVEEERTQHASTEADRDRLLHERQAQDRRLDRISRGVARWTSRAVLAVLALALLGASAGSAFYSQSIALDSWWLAWVITSLLAYGAIWVVLSEIFDISLKDVADSLERRIHHTLLDLLRNSSS
jgi:hypothetical protein